MRVINAGNVDKFLKSKEFLESSGNSGNNINPITEEEKAEILLSEKKNSNNNIEIYKNKDVIIDLIESIGFNKMKKIV